MALSVIVTSYESPASLERCLQALSLQVEAAEIVISDCSAVNPGISLQQHFPRVRFLHFERKHSVPELRWMALPHTSEAIVAAVEARCVPTVTWCSELLAAHALRPECPAIGGPVLLEPRAPLFAQGLYFCEYGMFSPPLEVGLARVLSGANLSYKREALQTVSDLTSRGEWETLLHQRWLQQGRLLGMCGAAVTFFNSMSKKTALRQRWHYGRGFAADRVRGRKFSVRLCYAVASIVLPALLTARLAFAAKRKHLLLRFLRASAWVMLLNASWSLGEAAGYLAGKSLEPTNF